ncbi:hypothetical protein J2T57_002123 [Natronocella acetinitrilica]|uniref:Uncharacterized protein n=1 Tax=Natronocella acetinitrilica TaxID=414046 RepID=A0AAE3G377_9GAMM|nr:hypothetical protein [Natronocella acetinitrilica]MCP1674985.1 hypothetical protein [Natronocella acetinitrilica]
MGIHQPWSQELPSPIDQFRSFRGDEPTSDGRYAAVLNHDIHRAAYITRADNGIDVFYVNRLLLGGTGLGTRAR